MASGDGATAAVAAAAQAQRKLPPGYQFMPTDEDILKHYLRNKVSEKAIVGGFINDIKFSELFEMPPNRFVPCNPRWRDWYFFVHTEKDWEENAKEIMVGNCQGFWKFRGDSYGVQNEEDHGEVMGLKRDAVYYRIRASHPTKPKRTHWAMVLYQLPINFEGSNNFKCDHRMVEKWSVVRIRRGKSYECKKLRDWLYEQR